MLQDITDNMIFHYALIFARFGTLMLFIPGFGESYVTARSRLSLALVVTLVLFPILSPSLPKLPSNFLSLTILMLREITIGLFFGLVLRVIQGTLHIAGMKIAFMAGLSAATLFDANQSTQGSVIGGLLSILGIILFFTTNLHHLFLAGFNETYKIFPLSEPVPFDQIAASFYATISKTFSIAFKISAPVIIVGTMLYLSAGLIGRLMPNMQVFFVLLPVQIGVAILFLFLSLSSISLIYIRFFEEKLLYLLGYQ